MGSPHIEGKVWSSETGSETFWQVGGEFQESGSSSWDWSFRDNDQDGRAIMLESTSYSSDDDYIEWKSGDIDRESVDESKVLIGDSEGEGHDEVEVLIGSDSLMRSSLSISGWEEYSWNIDRKTDESLKLRFVADGSAIEGRDVSFGYILLD